MGYYTQYSIEVVSGDHEVKRPCPTCGTHGMGGTFSVLDAVLLYEKEHPATGSEYVYAIEGGDETKWYGWKEDMKRISLNWPGVVFKLHGEGEEAGDIWDAYITEGKIQFEKAEVKVAGFDPSKLKG